MISTVNLHVYVLPGLMSKPAAHVVVKTAGLRAVRVPQGSSTIELIVTVSAAEVFLTFTSKAKMPPGSSSDVGGSAVFVTSIEDGRSVIVTVAPSLGLFDGRPFGSAPWAPAVFVTVNPGFWFWNIEVSIHVQVRLLPKGIQTPKGFGAGAPSRVHVALPGKVGYLSSSNAVR